MVKVKNIKGEEVEITWDENNGKFRAKVEKEDQELKHTIDEVIERIRDNMDDPDALTGCYDQTRIILREFWKKAKSSENLKVYEGVSDVSKHWSRYDEIPDVEDE
jgi:hypothetical protein